MSFIPKGEYLSVEQYRLRVGLANRAYIRKAIQEGRLPGAIVLDKETIIIPRDAIILLKQAPSGKTRKRWLNSDEQTAEELEDFRRFNPESS